MVLMPSQDFNSFLMPENILEQLGGENDFLNGQKNNILSTSGGSDDVLIEPTRTDCQVNTGINVGMLTEPASNPALITDDQVLINSEQLTTTTQGPALVADTHGSVQVLTSNELKTSTRGPALMVDTHVNNQALISNELTNTVLNTVTAVSVENKVQQMNPVELLAIHRHRKISPSRSLTNLYNITKRDSSSGDANVMSQQHLKVSQSLSATDLHKLKLGEAFPKRNTICISTTASDSNDDITDPSIYLSKSMTNLNRSTSTESHQQSNSKTKRKFSNLFSLKHDSATITTDINLLGTTHEIPKIRTPSLFRKFSKPPELRNNNKLLSTSTSDLNIPIVNVIKEEGQPIKKSRSFSLKGLNSHKTLVSPTDHDEQSNGLRIPQQKTFPALRSPFSRPKFEKDTLEVRKTVYDEMLKSIQENNCKRLKLLLKRRRTDVNTFEHNLSLVHEAAFKGCPKCLKAVIKTGWSVDLADESGWKPIHAAVLGQSLDTVRVLLNHGTNANSVTTTGLTPLHLAVQKDDLYIVHELFQNGSDPLIQHHSFESPFQLAINLKKDLILEYMLVQSCFLVTNSL